MKKFNYTYYLGNSEQFKYTAQATSFEDFKNLLTEKWGWGNCVWNPVEVSDGYPEGSKKFLLTDSVTYPNLGTTKTNILIFEPKKHEVRENRLNQILNKK